GLPRRRRRRWRWCRSTPPPPRWTRRSRRRRSPNGWGCRGRRWPAPWSGRRCGWRPAGWCATMRPTSPPRSGRRWRRCASGWGRPPSPRRPRTSCPHSASTPRRRPRRCARDWCCGRHPASCSSPGRTTSPPSGWPRSRSRSRSARPAVTSARAGGRRSRSSRSATARGGPRPTGGGSPAAEAVPGGSAGERAAERRRDVVERLQPAVEGPALLQLERHLRVAVVDPAVPRLPVDHREDDEPEPVHEARDEERAAQAHAAERAQRQVALLLQGPDRRDGVAPDEPGVRPGERLGDGRGEDDLGHRGEAVEARLLVLRVARLRRVGRQLGHEPVGVRAHDGQGGVRCLLLEPAEALRTLHPPEPGPALRRAVPVEGDDEVDHELLHDVLLGRGEGGTDRREARNSSAGHRTAALSGAPDGLRAAARPQERTGDSRPSTISRTRSQWCRTSWSWVTMTAAIRWVRHCSASSATMSWLRARSRAAVGSSTMSSPGSLTSARAMPTRCRSPPESCAGRLCARWPIPTASRSGRGSKSRDLPRRWASRWARRSWSAAVSAGMRLPDWKTKPRFSLRNRASAPRPRRPRRAPRSCPRTVTSPEVGAARAPETARSEDFPAPEGPITATNSPGWTSRSTRSRARTRPAPSPTSRVTSRSRRLATGESGVAVSAVAVGTGRVIVLLRGR